MKLELDVAEDTVDEIVMAALRRTIKSVADPKFAALFPDRDEITAACNVLLNYYGPPAKDAPHLAQSPSTEEQRTT